MDDGALLLRAILENPAEDTPRLAYADWLKERGEPRGHQRGDYVRYALSYDWHAAEDGNPYGADAGEEYPLKFDVWPYQQWPDSVHRLLKLARRGPPTPGVRFRWRRGFVDRVELPCALFVECAKALFRAHPITRVVLTDVTPELDPPHDEPDGNPHILVGVDTEKDVLFGSRVPMELFDMLPGSVAGYDGDGLWPHKVFPTATHAAEALSCTCVNFGRELAGLPRLPAAAVA